MKTSSLQNLQQEKLLKIMDSCLKAQASSLSKMLNRHIKNHLRMILQTEFYKIEEAISKLLKKQVFAVYVRCEGDLRLELLFFLSISEAKRLAACLLGGKTQKDFTTIGRSSIAETGNIMAGTFLNALSSKTGLNIQASVPGLAIDSLEAILGTPVADIIKTAHDVLVIENEIRSTKDHLVIHSIIMLEPEGARKILQKAEDYAM